MHCFLHLFQYQTELGRPAKRGFTLPDYDFTYGRPNLAKDGGAAEAMTGWSPTAALPIFRKEKKPDRLCRTE